MIGKMQKIIKHKHHFFIIHSLLLLHHWNCELGGKSVILVAAYNFTPKIQFNICILSCANKRQIYEKKITFSLWWVDDDVDTMEWVFGFTRLLLTDWLTKSEDATQTGKRGQEWRIRGEERGIARNQSYAKFTIFILVLLFVVVVKGVTRLEAEEEAKASKVNSLPLLLWAGGGLGGGVGDIHSILPNGE